LTASTLSLYCGNWIWSEEEKKEYEELNKGFEFLESPNLNKGVIHTNDFPVDDRIIKPAKKLVEMNFVPAALERNTKSVVWN
jgi:hypothetical protein